MMKKQFFLGLCLVGLTNSSVQARSNEAVAGVLLGGAGVTIGLGYAAHRILGTFQERNFTTITGAGALAYGVGALAVQKYLEVNGVERSFHLPAKGIAFLMTALAFAGFEYNVGRP